MLGDNRSSGHHEVDSHHLVWVQQLHKGLLIFALSANAGFCVLTGKYFITAINYLLLQISESEHVFTRFPVYCFHADNSNSQIQIRFGSWGVWRLAACLIKCFSDRQCLHKIWLSIYFWPRGAESSEWITKMCLCVCVSGPAAALQQKHPEGSDVAQERHREQQQVGECVGPVLEGIVVMETLQQLPSRGVVAGDEGGREQTFYWNTQKYTHKHTYTHTYTLTWLVS